MLILRKVAITGGLASGKSTVGALFKNLGAYLLDTDAIAHSLLKSQSIQKKIIDSLGSQVVDGETLSRTKMAEQVFQNPDKLDQLENILHPHIREEVNKQYKQACKEQKWNLFVVEIPLLFETDATAYYDQTIAVIANNPVCQKRFLDRGLHKVTSYEQRIKRQLSQEEKARRADFTLYNNGTLTDLKESFQKIYLKIIQ